MLSLLVKTWNLCLGLENKKDYVSSVINDKQIAICCLQEVELESSYPMDILSFRGYTLETEWNDTKLRCAIYIKNIIPQHIDGGTLNKQISTL